MKELIQYIKESYEADYLKLSHKDKEKLLELDLEYGKIMLIARYETVVRDVFNIDEEFEKFKTSFIDNGIKYFPTLDHQDLEYNKYDLPKRISSLIYKFNKLNCFLSRYYVKNLLGVKHKIRYLRHYQKPGYKNTNVRTYNFDDKLIDKAMTIVTAKYEMTPDLPEYEKNINADEAAEIVKSELEKLGYDWEIIMKENMPPRMGVNPEKTFRIKKDAMFSKIDIDSLIAHEIKTHVAKRFYGYKSGLFLFVFGLDGKNMFDEGLAIWNTLNTLDKPKPNAMFKVAVSYIISYYCTKYDFCDTFTKVKELLKDADFIENKDEFIFNSLMRAKRAVIDSKQLGYWTGDIDYFRGYEAVKKMTDEERDDILKYNIGPKQFFELDAIKKFLKINEFKPITNDKLELIKRDYIFKD